MSNETHPAEPTDLEAIDALVYDHRQGLRPEDAAIDGVVRLAAELRAAREAVGPAWFLGGVDLATAIERKCVSLEHLGGMGDISPGVRELVLKTIRGAAQGLRHEGWLHRKDDLGEEWHARQTEAIAVFDAMAKALEEAEK
jgi:hypothetical protein